jgi:Flp pilus assembly protein TadG
VEFALIVPLLLLLICGVIDFGRVLNVYVGLTDAVREGARYSVLNSGSSSVIACSYTARAGPVTSSACWPIISDAMAVAPQTTPDHITAFSMSYSHYGTNDGSGGTLAAHVAIQYRFQPITSLVIGGATISLSVSSTYLQQ